MTQSETAPTTVSTPKAPWRIGVDVGGTFTDLVLADSRGKAWVAKVPSVPSDPSQGVLAAVQRIAVDLGLPKSEVLSQCSLFVHGSTIATNTMLEGKAASVGLITTEGFRDTLEIRRGLRSDQWNHRAPYAPVLVPRYLRRSIPGRIDADGSEHQPLDTSSVPEILADFENEQVETVAIALMNSFVDDRHEQQLAQVIREYWSKEWVTCSAEVSPLMGEYERSSTAVVNAALSPRIVKYLRSLDAELMAQGLSRPILLVQSNGGAASVDQLANRPVNLLLSGPAAAVGALNLYRRAIDHAGVGAGDEGNLISMEIGGTSCDVLLMSNGEVATRDDVDIAGYHVSTPAIDIHTIGAGGGTIAGVDEAGLLYVGPEGAGADPGPACYGIGGKLPTVTDAHLVLGRLRPGKSAGGTLDLDIDAAREAINIHVAQKLNMSTEEAAAGIIELVEQHLLSAVEHISIERGHSPRRFTLVAAGGAGPMHGANVAAGLGCARVHIPRDAGALCAIGMLHADVRQDFTRFLLGSLDEMPTKTIEEGFDSLTDRALAVLSAEGFSEPEVTLNYEVELHHPGQLWSIRVAVGAKRIGAQAARSTFEAEYQRLYGHVQDEGTIMVSSLRLTARGSTGEVEMAGGNPSEGLPDPIDMRPVWFPGTGWAKTAVHDGSLLRPGDSLDGPALIEEATTTVVARPGDRLWVDNSGDFFIDVAQTDDKVEHRTGEMDPVVLALMQNRLDQISRHHLPDWVIARPIFVGATDPVLAGFCCNRAHQSDIGGGLAGTYNPEATEIWQEGIRLPVMRLIDEGRVREDLWELLLLNCRTPELLDGDLLAMLGSTQIGGERVVGLATELGIDAYLSYLDGVLDHADRRMRSAVLALPDGIYFGEDHTDNDCFKKVDIAVRVKMTIDGDAISVDFSETDPQIEGFKNSSVANTYSSVYLAISSFFDTSIPRNEGTYRCVSIVAPEGSIVNALPPAPMTMNTVYVAHEIVIAVWQALASADPTRACAAWSKTMHGHVAGRRDDGSTWVMYQWHAMGTPGATAERDGFAQMGHLISLGGLDMPNLEFHEQHYPVRYICHEQRCDNAGPGAMRGGTGIRYEADILKPAIWSFRAEGLDTPSGHGVEGGGTGGVGLEWIVPTDSDVDGPTFVPPKYGVTKLGPARMIAETPGGGGWGDPFNRDAELVLRDVRDGVVSRQAARRDYGVVITTNGQSVDAVATAAVRGST